MAMPEKLSAVCFARGLSSMGQLWPASSEISMPLPCLAASAFVSSLVVSAFARQDALGVKVMTKHRGNSKAPQSTGRSWTGGDPPSP